MEYLDFEIPIKELVEQLDKCKIIGEESGVDRKESYKNIEDKLLKTKKKQNYDVYLYIRILKSYKSINSISPKSDKTAIFNEVLPLEATTPSFSKTEKSIALPVKLIGIIISLLNVPDEK